MNDYPAPIVPVNHVEPVPRRIRAYLGGETVLDTARALYVWEWPHYPQYYVPLDDVGRDLLVSEGHTQRTGRGVAELHGLRVGQAHRPRAARLITEAAVEGLDGTVRFEWAALDAWFGEHGQVFVHPRSPYTRVDTLRSNRPVRVELDGVLLADSQSPVTVYPAAAAHHRHDRLLQREGEHLRRRPVAGAAEDALLVMSSRGADQPFRSWATRASACARVIPREMLAMGSTRLPPARKIT